MTIAPISGSRRPRGGTRLIAPVVAALLLLGQQAGLAEGHHGGRPIGSFSNCQRPGVSPPRCSSVGDDLFHNVYFDASLTEGLATSLRDTMAEDYDPTDLVMIEQAEIDDSTDVIVFSQDYGDNGAAGWVNCPRDAPQGISIRGHRWCRMQEVHFNLTPRLGVFFADDASRDHVTCHELGHTLGLRHWGNPPQSAEPVADTCMNANTPDGPTGLHQIDVDHINAYPYGVSPPPYRSRLLAQPGTRTDGIAAAWSASIVEAVELEHYATLPELVASADAVVRGTVTGVTAGRVFGGASGRSLHYAAATIRVGAVLAGELPSRDATEMTLEIPLFGGPETLPGLQSSLGGSESVFFLRNKATSAREAGLGPRAQRAESRFYRLMTLGAVLLQENGRVNVPAEDPEFLASLTGLPFDAAVARVRSAAE